MNRSVQIDEIVSESGTKSDKIRALAQAGISRGDIARLIGVRYQFVRNVLVEDERRRAARSATAATTAPQAGSGRDAAPGLTTRLHVSPDGSIVLPPVLRKQLGLEQGGVLLATLEDDALRLLTIPAAVRRAQALVRQFVPEGISLVDELLEDRRREAEHEQADG